MEEALRVELLRPKSMSRQRNERACCRRATFNAALERVSSTGSNGDVAASVASDNQAEAALPASRPASEAPQ